MWYKLKDKEPYDKNIEYFIRNGGDKYIGWWDNDEGEFYMIEKDCSMSYFYKEEYPDIEWWEDVEEEGQDMLWDKIEEAIDDYSGQIYDTGKLPTDLRYYLVSHFAVSRK